MNDAHRPVFVGAAQLCLRDPGPDGSNPLDMLEQVARQAAADAGAGDALLRQLDTVGLVEVIAWKPANGPGLLAERLGAPSARAITTGVGGEIPLSLANHVASEVAAGRSRVALLAGCNNVKTLRGLRAQRRTLDWPTGGAGTPEFFGDTRAGASERETRYGLATPSDIYPVFGNALRAQRGLDLEAHRQRMGRLFAQFSEVAAENPYAWFPQKRSPEELVTVNASNRMISFPYPKYLNAVIDTEQAAAVWVVSAETASALGIPEERQVHWCGGASTEEAVWFPSERAGFADCPAQRAAVLTALERAGWTLDDVDAIDLYSCFPSAVEMACEMIGLDEDDPRGLTVTGGLPYAGGPGSAYCLHSLAAMIERLRAGGSRNNGGPRERGLVTGNGWYLTKHSATLLSRTPPARVPTDAGALGAVAGDPPPPIRDEAAGPGRIETYTVRFERDGSPARGIIVGRLESGERFLANTPNDRALLEDLTQDEAVGRGGVVSHRDGANVFEPD